MPTVADLLASPIGKYITISTDNCGYSVTEEEFIVNYVPPMFLKTKAAEIKEDNPNWHEANTGPFSENIRK